MPADSLLRARVEELVAGGDGDPLAELLLANCNLPGPRANLELIAVTADAAGRHPESVDLFAEWLRVQTEKGDPKEYLPSSAAVALGAIHVVADARAEREIEALLQSSANDARWRVREAVSMGLQRIGEHSFADLEKILRRWSDEASLLEQRAIVAALAHPPILKQHANAMAALELARPITERIAALSAATRKSDEFKTLKQGMGFALSVIVAACPHEGFAWFDELLDLDDRDVTAIVKENLSKNRLVRADAERVTNMLARID